VIWSSLSRRQRSAARSTSAWISVVSILALFAGIARAEDRRCEGPPACCTQILVDHLNKTTTVQVGIVVMGITNINERSGTWDADFYLYERWRPAAGFTPQTEIVNEAERHATQFDTTEERDGQCQRSRRVRSTLRAAYDLRRFPFDQQRLPLEISDDQFSTADVVYAEAAQPLGFDEGVRDAVPGWKVENDLDFAHKARTFAWESGAPVYDYAVFTVSVRRHVTYHLTKYFLPLLVIVIIAFSVFWIDAEDLCSQVTIGVTCVLAAIAFQFAEASTLPEVAYLTLADRTYAVCYIAIGLAVIETVYSNDLARRGKKAEAAFVDRGCRFVFPLVLTLSIAVSAIRAFS
jgi:hypothetical protein